MEGYELFNEYENELKAVNRFFPNAKYLRLFDRIINNETNIEIVKSGTLLYRARRNKINQEFTYKSELGINKNSKSHNRASPIGIAYIYLADEPNTAISEIRANVSDHATVATYTTQKELKILTLDSHTNYGGKLGDEFDSLTICGFILFLSHSFSRPVQETAELEYIPCQYFAEYCRKKGFDGIKYISSARGFHGDPSKNHFNYVIFDDNNVIQDNAFKYRVCKIEYTIEEIEEVFLKDDGEK